MKYNKIFPVKLRLLQLLMNNAFVEVFITFELYLWFQRNLWVFKTNQQTYEKRIVESIWSCQLIGYVKYFMRKFELEQTQFHKFIYLCFMSISRFTLYLKHITGMHLWNFALNFLRQIHVQCNSIWNIEFYYCVK